MKTADPVELLSAIDAAISDGSVDTWTVDDDGDYSLTTPDWAGFGWVRPTIPSEDEIVLNVLTSQNHRMTTDEYAILHAQFLQMLLDNFDAWFVEATITAQGASDDVL